MIKSLFTLLCAVTASVAASAPLEYRFNIGEELVYELVDKEDLLEKQEESDRRYETKARWNVYPIRQNDDGSWHLVVRTWVKLLRYDREETEEGKFGEWKKEPHVRFENTFLGYCDLMPDGSYKKNPTLGKSYLFELLPELLFVPLPMADGDVESSPRIALISGTEYKLATQFTTANSATLTGTLERSLSANYESTITEEIEFDVATGRVMQIVETNKSGWNKHPSHSRTTYRLVDVVEHSPEWLTNFEAAAKSYFQDRNAWWDYKSQARKVRTEEACRKLAEDARERIVQNRETIDISEVQSAYDGLIALHDREEEWDVEAAIKREALYAKPPVDWISTNLSGESRRRADYDGKVVILDFWYRGCGHCILALPKVKALHAKYEDQGVVVLGVNNDRELEDAHHVVNTFSIPYESVCNVMAPTPDNDPQSTDDKEGVEESERRISTEYKVNGWPTFVVLDQTGRVAEVVDGNAEDLVEHLSQVIDNLLADPSSN